jgi:hypothetical protein
MSKLTSMARFSKARFRPKNTARAKYEEAISEGNTSILLERNYDGSFTLELGNLMAGEECKIMIRYAQTLSPEHGQIRMMLPTTIAPRYGNPITQGRLQPHQVPVTDPLAEYPFDITVRCWMTWRIRTSHRLATRQAIPELEMTCSSNWRSGGIWIGISSSSSASSRANLLLWR